MNMRLETTSENIARDMADGRFPERSEPKLVSVDSPDAWERIVSDPELSHARSKLSINELRKIIQHVEAVNSPSLTPTEEFALWLSRGPKLAKLAGCHVDIKVTEYPPQPKQTIPHT